MQMDMDNGSLFICSYFSLRGWKKANFDGSSQRVFNDKKNQMPKTKWIGLKKFRKAIMCPNSLTAQKNPRGNGRYQKIGFLA